MIKVMRYFMLVLLLCFVLQGCASVTQVAKEPITSEKVTFIIPKNIELLNNNSILKGLKYENTLRRGRTYPNTTIADIDGIEVTQGYSSSTMTVTYYSGEINNVKRFASFVRYAINIDASESDGNFLITLQPTEKEIVQGTDALGQRFLVPNFSNDALVRFLSEPKIQFKTEVDSEYNTESVYANFKRQLKEEYFTEPYTDPVTGKIYKSAFSLPVGFGNTAKLFVEAYPYRNGTKTVITVSLSLTASQGEKTIDVGSKINYIIKEVTKVVKS